MAAGDAAILTGISVYPNEGYTQLDGPPNDLKIIKEWLVDPAGGGLRDENIIELASPNPYPEKLDPDSAPPVSEDFHRKFQQLLRQRMHLKERRLNDRLYLYFSGHGFCNRSQIKPPEAALYSANATREFYEHIFGTYYARVAVAWALFAEVVLIMDCCRDSEITREPMPKPIREAPDDGLSAQVKLMCIYAVPKGGKAQERKIPDRGNKVHGLLTHALVKALNEARPTTNNAISATALRDYIHQTWTPVCGQDAAPRPEISLPPNGEIYFQTKDLGGEFEIRYTSPPPADWKVTLRDGNLKTIAQLALVDGQDPDLWAPDGPLLSVKRNGAGLKLRLKLGFYEYETNPPVRIGRFKVDGGGGHVDLL
jgi:hypothetical protein